MRSTAVVIAVGEELLGVPVDAGAGWLGRRLAAAEVQVVAAVTVGARADRLDVLLDRALQDADVVVVTGGLGPTGDGITGEAVGALAAALAAPMTSPVGIAPGLRLEVGERLVVALPGEGHPPEALITALLAELRGRSGGTRNDPLDQIIHRLLRARRATVAVAESLTGGLIGAALSRQPGSSETFRGSLVVYATDLKESLAGVPGPLLDSAGAVSAQTAGALANGARVRLGATFGVAATGVAGPAEQEGQPVGTVHLAVAGPAGAIVRSLHLRGDRDQVRAGTVTAALDLLRRQLAPAGDVAP